jgi:capsular polysaccharide biosynthesis protein
MDNNLTYEQKQDDEIDLRELILILWKKKTLIVSFTLIAALIAGIFSIFFIKPVYHAKLDLVINMPETYLTKYGDYTLPITSNQQYIDLITSNDILLNTLNDMGDHDNISVDSLRSRITIVKSNTNSNIEQNHFVIKIAANSPEQAKKLSEALYENYTEFIDVLTIEGAANYFANDYSNKLKALEVELRSAKEILKKNEELLSKTPQTINQKEALTEIENIKVSEFVVLENIINPGFTKIENDIILNKQEINNLENTISVYNTYLEELDVLNTSLNDYRESGNAVDLEAGITRISKTYLQLPSEPLVPSQKSSPNTTTNVGIGAILGGMLSVMFVLIKEYWFKVI